MGPSGSGKVDLHERRSAASTGRPRARYRLDGETSSAMSATRSPHVRNRKIGFVFQQFNLLDRARRARQCRTADDLCRRGPQAAHAQGRRRTRAAWALPSACTTGRRSFPAASSSASRSPGRWSTRRGPARRRADRRARQRTSLELMAPVPSSSTAKAPRSSSSRMNRTSRATPRASSASGRPRAERRAAAARPTPRRTAQTGETCRRIRGAPRA